jgi:PAS domain S-box-containing protein
MVLPPHENDGPIASNLTLSLALEGLPLGIILTDSQGTIIEANSHIATFLQRTQNIELIDRPLSDIFPISHGQILSVLSDSKEFESIQLQELPDLCVLVVPIKDIFTGLSITVMDKKIIGSYFGSAPSLTVLNKVYDRILNHDSHGVIVYDTQGRIVLVNNSAAKSLGVLKEDLEGLSIFQINEAKLTDNHIALDVLVKKCVLSQITRYSKTGKTVCLVGFPILNHAGEVILVVVTERDLTSNLETNVSSSNEWELISIINEELDGQIVPSVKDNSFVQNSPAMSKALDIAYKFARNQSQEILILGDPGTEVGKIARYIHDNSTRHHAPFTEINCAIMEDKTLDALIFGRESESFGERSYNSGAGLLEAVGKGSIFLKNIEKLSLTFQVKLFNFMSNKEFYKLEGNEPILSKATLIFSTSVNLENLVKENLFINELYNSLSPNVVSVPPLKSRREDILDMAREELKRLNLHYGVAKYLDQEAALVLMSHDYPGNTRELYNAIHQAALFSATPNIGSFLKAYFSSEDVPFFFDRKHKEQKVLPAIPGDKIPGFKTIKDSGLSRTLGAIEKRLLLETLNNCRSTREMASILGISQASVSRKLRKYRIDAPGKYYQEE